MTDRIPSHWLRHPVVPQAHFVRGVEWHSWIARTSLGTVTITRRPRPKGRPQWGRWTYDLHIEFTDGTVHDETTGGSVRGAKRAAREAIYRYWNESRWPKPRYDYSHYDPQLDEAVVAKVPKPRYRADFG